METPDKSFSDFVDIVKSWIPRQSEPANLSRDFWMPDHSCRVCYECDAQFTIFNRRHHCRLCGRIFCAKCTANSIPVASEDPESIREDAERIRVCNYCFKQWEQERAAAELRMHKASPGFSPTLSAASLLSTKCSGTISSSIMTGGSFSYSTASYHHVAYGLGLSPSQSIHLEPYLEKSEVLISQRDADSIVDMEDPSSFMLRNNRSDDDYDYGSCHLSSESRRLQHSDDYYDQVELNKANQDCNYDKALSPEENLDAKEISTPIHASVESHASLDGTNLLEDVGHGYSYDDDTSAPIYGIEGTDLEPVDFENNGLLWLPPDPADEEEEREGDLFDDDSEDVMGQCDYLGRSNSSGSGESRSRDQTLEEHKKVMKNIVDGHFRALVAQLLQVGNLPMGEEDDGRTWLDIISSLSWEVATFLKPDTSKGGGMDPGSYVKIKCIACGSRSESMVVKGIVCKKTVANRRMASNLGKPRLLILGGALEYQRVSNMLSSLDTLLQQEMDHLKMAVARIDAHHPNVLLVEKSVSGFAQDFLLAKDISLVLNMKRPLLEHIARCTGAQIVASVDHLSSPKLGYCDLFHVEKYSEDHGSVGQGRKKVSKNLMFFEGCPKPIGCTVLLKGANGNELKKVKHILQYGIFAAYHLALETSFLADEGASLPELPLNSAISVTLPDKPSRIERSISTVPGFADSVIGKPQLSIDAERPRLSGPILPSRHQPTKMNVSPVFFESHSSASRCTSPPIDVKGLPGNKSNRAQWIVEPTCTSSLTSLCDSSTVPEPQRLTNSCASKASSKSGFADCHEAGTLSDTRTGAHDFSAHFDYPDRLGTWVSGDIATKSENENKRTIEQQLDYSDLGDSHQDSSMHEHRRSMDDFPPSPSDHQSILVSLSTRCVWKGTVCERGHLFRIKYYGNFDKPLGRFLRDHLFDQSCRCRSCDMPSEAHVHCYTHRQGSLTISVRKLPEVVMPGEGDGKIWMWHRCLHCPRTNGLPPATQRVVMSDAAWGLSFGKFLELSFSNNAAASRVASCGHSIHRDCLRFYGLGKMVACFRYAAISVHSVYLPPPKLDFNFQLQTWIQKEANEVADRTKLLFTEARNTLRRILDERTKALLSKGNIEAQELQCCVAELEEIIQKEATEFEESLHQIFKKEVSKGQPVIDILEVNKLRRQLLFQSYLWNQHLRYASCADSSPGELFSELLGKDKEKLNAMDKPVDLNLVSALHGSCDTSDTIPSNARADEPSNENMTMAAHQGGTFPNNATVYQQKRDLKMDSFQGNRQKVILSTRTSASDQLDPLDTGVVVRRALSDGQVPITANLSDTLDAKWRGETGLLLADVRMSDSVASVEASASAPAYEESERRNNVDIVHSLASALPTKWGDSAEDFLSWIRMPFLSFYRSLNKSWVSASRFDGLKEYNPEYVSLSHEIEQQSGARLLLPVGVNDTVIPIYDDEPTSIIAYALVSPDYNFQMCNEQERPADESDVSFSLPLYASGSFHPFQSMEEVPSETFRSFGSIDDSILSLSRSRSSIVLDPLNSTKAMHVKTTFADEGIFGKVKYTVTSYCAKSFDALRRNCCSSELDFIRSISRCKKWGAQGGKSNVFFAKTLDDRFIVKQVTKTELESFIKFAPEYFKYLSESIGSRSPTCLAKILGIYQVTSKYLKGGKETRMDVLVMENLFFGRNLTRLYDLKGSARSRYNPDSTGTNKVLLDQNLIEAMPTSPIFVGNKAKRLLERAVWNDTSFLASIDVMDYSLLVGVDEERHELVLGIIDFMRQYTWDKHLETWVKASGILGGPKNASPTVISPKQYKKRFRKAMSAYFLMVPDQWWPPSAIPSKTQTEDCADNQHSGV